MFLGIPMSIHLPVPPGPADRVDIGIEHDVIEVPDDNGSAGENGFVIMDGGGDIDRPARKITGNIDLEPNHQPGDAHDNGSPNYCPIFGLFCVTEAAEPGLGGPAASQVS